MNHSPINNSNIRLDISRTIENSFYALAANISDILIQYELKYKDDSDKLQQVISEHDQISFHIDQILNSHLIKILEEI